MIWRILLIAITAFGTFAGIKLSISHFNTGETCPILGIIPACYIVLIGYALMLIAATFKLSRKLFYLGWTPVFLLAAAGVTLEIVSGSICPVGAMGIPQCFISLAMVISCAALEVLNKRKAAAV